MREMAPIGEMAPGCAKKQEINIKNPFAPGAISRMITVVRTKTEWGSLVLYRWSMYLYCTVEISTPIDL